jgi:hypothetical protein
MNPFRGKRRISGSSIFPTRLFDTGLLRQPSNTELLLHKKGEYAAMVFVNIARTTGLLREVPSPTTRAAYTNDAHTLPAVPSTD